MKRLLAPLWSTRTRTTRSTNRSGSRRRAGSCSGAVGHRQDGDGARALGREADAAHRDRRTAALLEMARRVRKGAAGSVQESAAGPRRACCFSTRSTPSRRALRPTTSGADVYLRILSQLLREIDNLRDVKGVVLLAATNRPERVEPSLLRSGRFDYIVRFSKPDAAERAGDHSGSAAASCRSPQTSTWTSSRGTPTISRARISRACARRRRSSPSRTSARRAAGAVRREDDFEAVDYRRHGAAWTRLVDGRPTCYTELTVWTRGIIMDKEGRDIVSSVVRVCAAGGQVRAGDGELRRQPRSNERADAQVLPHQRPARSRTPSPTRTSSPTSSSSWSRRW